MNREEILKLLRGFATGHPEIAFAYLFGSLAKGNTRPESDIDVAIFLNLENPSDDLFKIRLTLLHELYHLLGTERVDLIVLNQCPLSLKYRVLRQGILFSQNVPVQRRKFQERITRDYLDLLPFLQAHNKIVQQRMREGSYFV
jgi:predicted nucleotidyltransferase